MKLVEAALLAKGHQRWIATVTSRYRARLRLLYSKPTRGREEVLQIFEIEVEPRLKERLTRYLQNNSEISELEITNSSRGRLIGLIRAKGVIMRLIADSDCFLVRASGEYGAPIRWEVLGTPRSIRSLEARLRGRGIRHSVVDMSEMRKRVALTARQDWLLRSAFERGYFDTPKRVRIRALAGLVGVSPPTLHESLRRSQRRLVEEHIGMNQPLGRGLAGASEGPLRKPSSALSTETTSI